MTSFLDVSGVGFQNADGFVLKNISFQQRALQKIALAGETGSGKSTLMQIIAGLAQAESGTVHFLNERILGPAEKLVPGHPEIAYLSQQFELPPFLRVEQILSYANKLSEKEADALFRICQIDHLFKRRTDHASGGERQRIAMAQLLCGKPKLLLLDEPFSNLDMGHKTILKSVIRDLGEKLGITCILVSHDPYDTLSWADEIIVLKEGGVVQSGNPSEIYNKPASEYVASLFGPYIVLDAALEKALFKFSKKDTNNLKKIQRPENFTIVKDADHGLPATINNITYYGSFYMVDVAFNNTIIPIRCDVLNYTIGQTVYVALI